MRRPAYNKGKSKVLDWLRERVNYASDECLVWPFSRNWNGYGHLKFEEKIQKAHRVMCILAHGRPPTPKHVAAHSCHNGHGGCVHPGHLSWTTPSENLLQRREAGTNTKKRWSRHRRLVNDEQIAQIVALKGQKNQREIAAMFGISYQHVSIIQQGKLARMRKQAAS